MAKHVVSSRISRDIVDLLVDRGMTLTEVASLLHLSKSYISRVRAGTRKFTLDHLETLEEALGESLPILLMRAIPRQSVSPSIRALYDSTLTLLASTGSGKAGARRDSSKRRRAHKRAA